MRFLAAVEVDQARGTWLDPVRGAVRLVDYAEAWIGSRTVAGRPLAPRTRANYSSLLALHIAPGLGGLPLADVTPERVRLWHAGVSMVGATTAAQAYRFLHTVLATATAEGTYATNPCRLRGAGQAHAAERPLLTAPDVEQLTAAMPEHLRPLVLLGYWAALRLGELVALERGDLDLNPAAGTGTVRVERAAGEVANRQVIGEPKAHSRRTVHLPAGVARALAEHLERSPAGLPTARVFTRLDGAPLRHWDVQRYWKRARVEAGLPTARLHDLRHGGLTLAAQGGATLREVMRRAGHASSAAAMRYQHAADDRDRDLAARLEAVAERHTRSVGARSGHAKVIAHPTTSA